MSRAGSLIVVSALAALLGGCRHVTLDPATAASRNATDWTIVSSPSSSSTAHATPPPTASPMPTQ